MYSVTVTCSESEQDSLVARLWELGTAGVTQEANWLRAFFDEATVSPDFVVSDLRGYDIQVDTAEIKDWSEGWKASWRPFLVGTRFYLAPPWDESATPAGRMRVSLRPGMACGSGLHPCTRLCLELLETETTPGKPMLDVGTGSGILAEAGYLLGARPVIACDIDPDATPIAAENLRSAGIPAGCFTGSLRSVRSRMFPLVVANLNAVTLTAIGPDLRRVATGVLIVSGFPEEETAAVVQNLGMPVHRDAELEGWGGAVLRIPA